ncbi:hypothetical protein IQ266_18955 [filamentous cyanobacterium LEGE 11480]|uniref:Uncharacterized protein n=1 Tax=Romeriopsis navalis LEGE 11480 TaxID=2777977 RepID=A0A928Z5T3_9CYAN|nr:hypothetical protein [Romeriopsis navalis]MBE9031818.1 hypothetical protein [Romeriopsis navalis LEGE 11480]
MHQQTQRILDKIAEMRACNPEPGAPPRRLSPEQVTFLDRAEASVKADAEFLAKLPPEERSLIKFDGDNLDVEIDAVLDDCYSIAELDDMILEGLANMPVLPPERKAELQAQIEYFRSQKDKRTP